MTNVKTARMILFLLALCVVSMGGCLSQRLTAVQVIQNTQQAYTAVLACHAVVQADLDTDMFQESLQIEIWEQQSPAKIKIIVNEAASPQFAGLAFSSQDGQSIAYHAQTNKATVGPVDVVHLPQVIETLVQARRQWLVDADVQRAALQAKVREEALVVYKVDLPIENRGIVQYTIDARQWWVREVSYDDPHMGRAVIRLQSQECSESFDGSVFDLNIPDGAIIEEVRIQDNRQLEIGEAQARVSFRLREPAFLPEGTALIGAYQIDLNVAIIYGGSTNFTLVQGPNIGIVPQENAELISVRGRQGKLIQDPAHQGLLLTWREGETQFSIAGSLSRQDILKIAESLEWYVPVPEPGN